MSRIERKMYWAVREETMLHELPWPEVDAPGTPREVRLPAEDPDDCASVLLGWFDAGLITVMATGDQIDLGPTEARALLAGPASWSPSHSLVLTDRGEEMLRARGLA
jgi:hypothetical protein